MATVVEPEARQAADDRPPVRADGVELVGEFKDSGFREPPYIVRRADGQTIQLPQILYRIVEAVDGARSYEEIGEVVSERVRRGLDGEAVRFLVDGKLRPLGVIALADGSTPELPKADPLLALRFRAKVVPARAVHAITSVFRPLFWPPIVVVAVAAFLAVDAWLLFSHGLAPSVRAVIYEPAVLVPLFGGIALATALHEVGHATACRYGGARPGVMGVGIYVVWPAFYTDVTDAYRLDKKGRLRTDLGGVYFNAIYAVLVAGAYALSGWEPLLLLILFQNFAILQQLLPLLRLDGYYILTDATGVPDLLGRLKPILRSLKPGREPEPAVQELKPWVRWVVSGYLALLVPVLVLALVLMLVAAPRVFATAWDSFGVRWDAASEDFAGGRTLAGLADVLQLCALVLPAVGIAYTTVRVTAKSAGGLWSWSDGSPGRRGGLAVAGAAAAVSAAVLLWPNGEYRPIQPGERGTLASAPRTIAAIPTGRPAFTEERELELGGRPAARERRDSDRTEAEATATPTATSTSTAEASPEPTTQATAEPTLTPDATTTPGAVGTPEATVTPSQTPAQTTTPVPTP